MQGVDEFENAVNTLDVKRNAIITSLKNKGVDVNNSCKLSEIPSNILLVPSSARYISSDEKIIIDFSGRNYLGKVDSFARRQSAKCLFSGSCRASMVIAQASVKVLLIRDGATISESSVFTQNKNEWLKVSYDIENIQFGDKIEVQAKYEKATSYDGNVTLSLKGSEV